MVIKCRNVLAGEYSRSSRFANVKSGGVSYGNGMKSSLSTLSELKINELKVNCVKNELKTS